MSLLRAVGALALWAGYAYGSAKRGWGTARDRLRPREGWRSLAIAELRIQVPPDWGEVEPASDGGFVIHNRPRRFRVDGDAVWYASAIELRIRRPEMPGLPPMAPMTETCRTIEAAGGPIVLALAVANGVGVERRRQARRVFDSAHIAPGGPSITWPVVPRTGQDKASIGGSNHGAG